MSSDAQPAWAVNMVGWSYLSLPGQLQVWVTRASGDRTARWTWFVEDRERRKVLTTSEQYENDVEAKLAALLRLHEVYGERQTMIAKLIGELRSASPSETSKYPSWG